MKKGFTLVEMIVIICIISIVALLTAPNLMSTLTSSNAQVCKDHQKAIMSEYYAKRPYTDDPTLLGSLITSYKNEVCPNGGVIAITSTGLSCGIHGSY
ncbi:prepilin-type N-terminal cleavage/methylation domain-containing protein [Anaerorhabdus sp.]|uniref:prepilin-type N-terminal cleavage/methylation domain-containing protein n=1 Tax=Anaerorhabdus sp. TaxID=1872524 RepID=UPI002FC58CDD